ncbi:MAG: hypothetical protein JWO02_2204 [Solirubrobacterales bacterium]|nr:hypothetical protein [Solirubrobacterales bacterium]
MRGRGGVPVRSVTPPGVKAVWQGYPFYSDSAHDDEESTMLRRTVPATTDRHAAAGTGSAFLLLAGVVRFVVGIVVTVLVIAILFRVLGANQVNELVSAINDVGRALAGPFDGVFNLNNAKTEIAVNWGLAAVVYLAAGSLITGLLNRAALASAARSRL